MLLCGCVYEHAHLSVSRLVYEHKSTSRAAVDTLYLCGWVPWLGSDTAWLSSAWVLHSQGLGLNPGAAT